MIRRTVLKPVMRVSRKSVTQRISVQPDGREDVMEEQSGEETEPVDEEPKKERKMKVTKVSSTSWYFDSYTLQ